jgi:hypothetical protein
MTRSTDVMSERKEKNALVCTVITKGIFSFSDQVMNLLYSMNMIQ